MDARVGRAEPKFSQRGDHLLLRNTTFLYFVEQRLVAHAQLFSRAAAVPSYLLKRFLDGRTLSLNGRGFRDVGEARSGWLHLDRHAVHGGRLLLVALDIVELAGGDRHAAATADGGVR